MKRLLTLFTALLLLLAMVACTPKQEEEPTPEPTPEVTITSFEEYCAAELNTEVTIETYVQDHQSWWDNKITVYCQDEVGAYFIYEMACSEEDAAKLVPGTKIRVHGFKSEWSGEVEITDATFEILEGSYIAEPEDITANVADENIIEKQNRKVCFTDAVIKSIEYKNGEPGDDIYVTATVGETEIPFVVEVYLTGTDSEVYTTVGELKEGDTVDIVGFLYWYEGMNPHITSITVK
ncbi:MAG: hypothetical protein IIZ11_02505 [Erysipelotrichaceae bacterium]|nr:hypothetical protein [Erysipelotrichaceae bacterium]